MQHVRCLPEEGAGATWRSNKSQTKDCTTKGITAPGDAFTWGAERPCDPMNPRLTAGALLLVTAMAFVPTSSAYPWGPTGPPPGDSCGRDAIMFNCGEYHWFCSPSYNENPDICYWSIHGHCTIWVTAAGGCLSRA
jgi:hypothetical protein